MQLFVGTFTNGFMGGTPAQGLYVFDIELAQGAHQERHIATRLHSPSYIALHPTLPRLYSVERQWTAEDKAQGALAVWDIAADGQLKQLGRVPSGGAFSAHVSVAPDGRSVAVANPLGPNIAHFALTPDGRMARAPEIFTYTGRGPRARQNAPWPHSCWFTPASMSMLVCDLGLDHVHHYQRDAATQKLTPAALPFAQTHAGSGARHMAIHPLGRTIYVANELDGTISTLAFDSETGHLVTQQIIPAHSALCQPAEIILSADGAWLFVSLRGPEAIGVYAVDPQTQILRAHSFTPCLGQVPRHISLSPDGRFLLVCNQLSDAICVFAFDSTQGQLQPTGQVISVPSPSCALLR